MPSTKSFANSWDEDFNLLLPVLIIIAAFANVWLRIKEIDVGTTYWVLLGAFSLVFILAQLFIKGDNLEKLNSIIKAPFSVSLNIASAMLLIGAGFVIGVNLLITNLSSFSLVSFFFGDNAVSLSIPLFGSEINSQIFQSFSSAEVGTSLDWVLFNVVFNAGVVEELVFSLGAMIAGIMFSILIIEWIFDDKLPFGINRNFIIIAFGIAIASSLFTAMHVLNSNYDSLIEFARAFGFKAIGLISIYFFGIFLIFWVGYHMGNNFLWMIQEYGFSDVINTLFTSWQGWLILSIFLLSIWRVLTKFDDVAKELGEYWGR